MKIPYNKVQLCLSKSCISQFYYISYNECKYSACIHFGGLNLKAMYAARMYMHRHECPQQKLQYTAVYCSILHTTLMQIHNNTWGKRTYSIDAAHIVEDVSLDRHKASSGTKRLVTYECQENHWAE